MHILAKTLVRFSIASILFASILMTPAVSAYCDRCIKIEEARAKEQLEHPQPVSYYDDRIHLHDDSNQLKETPHLKEKLDPDKDQAMKDSYFAALFDQGEARQKSTPRDPSVASFYQNYSTIYTIFKTKDFLETLDGSFTLFIPTNQALEQIPNDLLIDLTKPENQEKLAALVSNHVVGKKILRKILKPIIMIILRPLVEKI